MKAETHYKLILPPKYFTLKQQYHELRHKQTTGQDFTPDDMVTLSTIRNEIQHLKAAARALVTEFSLEALPPPDPELGVTSPMSGSIPEPAT